MGLINLLEKFTELKETFNIHLPVYKRILQDTDEQPKEEIHLGMSERVPTTGASAPMELGAVTSWKGCAWNLEASLSESHTPGILTEASSRRRDQSLTPFSALLKRMGIEAENSKFLIMACSFW